MREGDVADRAALVRAREAAPQHARAAAVRGEERGHRLGAGILEGTGVVRAAPLELAIVESGVERQVAEAFEGVAEEELGLGPRVREVECGTALVDADLDDDAART